MNAVGIELMVVSWLLFCTTKTQILPFDVTYQETVGEPFDKNLRRQRVLAVALG